MCKLNSFFKRIFDIFASGVGIILLSPILIIIAIAIKLDSDGEILFKQKRVGRKQKTFKILKFRTMVSNAEKIGKQITIGKDSRITKVGAFLRKYKLDELPQLFNVFFGDMSLVGPRPEVPRYVELYTEKQKEVFNVKPGITDLASIKYSDENDLLENVENPEEYYVKVIMQDKLQLNLEYIRKSNLFFDIYIIFKTILKCM